MSKPKQARSVARLAAVQALYQMEVSGVGVEAVIREFSDHRFDRGRRLDEPKVGSFLGKDGADGAADFHKKKWCG